ncbi:MAG: rhodanese-like domain-containing protein [Chloroflexaceae bacterium]|nr:rhodanese-like domain-containing protein [Chloroflexaceae bacterium]NJL34316.1 rhodanese-like domain-containing protein [Chloroflexaceae bacterium]NJO05977.1 rhodanese-like domain-containing protein [Chloroflexaceae bacterium]
MQTISVQELRTMLAHEPAEDVLILDVRTPAEYRNEHLLGVANIPLDEIDKHTTDLSHYRHVYVHCNSGNRSQQACQKLNSVGLENLVNVSGGLQAWKDAGFPVQRARNVLPLMQQVQIAAGSLVLTGVVLSQTVDKRFIFLSAFVGAGLTYAGASGNCMMAKLLGQMPWNR